MDAAARLTGLATFARVVEEGGFSAAATALGLSKSAVSKQVAALEDRLGVRLLNRTTRRLALTDAGAALLERAQRILAEVEEAEAELSHLAAVPRGVLRVNAPLTFGIGQLAPLLPAFMAAHPDLTVDLALNDRLVDLVDEGFDLAVRVGRLEDSSLISRRLCCARRVVVASPAYVAAHGMPALPADLERHDSLAYTLSRDGGVWDLTAPDGRPAAVRPGPARLRANNGDLLRHAVLGGLGVALLPTFIVGPDLAAGRLVRLLPGWEDARGGVHAVWPHGRLVPAKVRVFVDALATHFAGIPAWEAGLDLPPA